MRLDPEQFGSMVVGIIKSAMKPVQDRLAALEQRTVTIERKSVLSDDVSEDDLTAACVSRLRKELSKVDAA